MTAHSDADSASHRSGRPAPASELATRSGPTKEGKRRGTAGGEGRPATDTTITSSSSSSLTSPSSFVPAFPPSPPCPSTPLASTPISSLSVPLGNTYAIAGREAHLSKSAAPGSVPTSPVSVPVSAPSAFEVATDVTPDCPTRRAERLALLSIAGEVMTTHGRLTGCLKARGDVLASVKTLPSGARVAGFAGAQVCRLIHLCPWCSAKARDERAREIDRRTSGWLNGGGTALFAVFTIADEPCELVAGTTTAVRACYTEMFRGGWLARFKKAYGFTGRIDAFEWTLRLNGSGHPHVQSIMLFDRVLTPVQADRAVVMLRRRWLAVTDAQGRHADLLAGFRAERIGLVDGKCRAVSRYMAKGSEAWTLGAELTRSDVKRSKNSMTFAPFDLVRYFAETGDTDAIFAWREFEKACRGVKSLRYSNGLKAVLDAACSLGRIPDAIDLTEDDEAEEDLAPDDDEVAEEVLEAGHEAVAVIEAPTWNWARRSSHIDGILTMLETCAAGAFVPALIEYLRRASAPPHIWAGVRLPDDRLI
jgi:hypothetical protein